MLHVRPSPRRFTIYKRASYVPCHDAFLFLFLRTFVKTFDDLAPSDPEFRQPVHAAGVADGQQPALSSRRRLTPVVDSGATVSAHAFVSAALAEPSVVRFLEMRSTFSGSGRCINTASASLDKKHEKSNVTLRAALRELVGRRMGEGTTGSTVGAPHRGVAMGTGGWGAEVRAAGRNSGSILWEDVEGVLFEAYNPTEMFGNAPSTVSITSAPSTGADAAEEKVSR